MARKFSKAKSPRKRQRPGREARTSKKRKTTPSNSGSCSISYDKVIEWELKNKHVDNLYQYLYDKIEHGGKLTLDTHSKASNKTVKSNSGESDSVDAPDAIVNWHTHPISCYLGERTVWGWPSGEDMRETIIFGLRGSACHIVPTIEGVYLIQPNPCVITSLINIANLIPRNKFSSIAAKVSVNDWDSFLRGIIVLAIEIYFRSTHVFRTIDYIQEYPKTTANDFVDFTNAFKLENMFNKSNIKGCSENIKCNQIQQFEDQRVDQVSFRKYVKSYEHDTPIHLIRKNGDSSLSGLKLLDVLNMGGLRLLKRLVLGSDCVFPIKEWHSGRMFLMRLYPNQVKMGRQWIDYSKLSNVKRWIFMNNNKDNPGSIRLNPKETLHFHLFDMKGACDYTDLKQHISHFSTRGAHRGRKFGKNDKIEVVGSFECTPCKETKKRAKKHKVKFHYFGSIVEALQVASDKAGKEVKTIPAFFKNGKYSSEPLF